MSSDSLLDSLLESSASPDLRALLEIVEEYPDDETSRQVLADWLEDQGQGERAELIHVQCALAHPDLPEEERASLQHREQELLDWLRDHWLIPLFGPAAEWQFERGLLRNARLGWRTFLEKGRELIEATWVRRFDLVGEISEDGDSFDLAELAASPLLARVRSLTLPEHALTPEQVEVLAASPWLAGLQHLDLSEDAVGVGEPAFLAGLHRLKGLRILRLSGNALGDEGLRVLLQGGFSNLRELDLSHNSITDQGLISLAGSPLLANLQVLNLSRNLIGDTGAAALAHSDNLASLRGLDLAGNFIGDAGMIALAACPALGALTGIDLEGNPFRWPGAQALVYSPYLRHLVGERYRNRLW
jgi:uncharacterized protein (TIGR02996 family)